MHGPARSWCQACEQRTRNDDIRAIDEHLAAVARGSAVPYLPVFDALLGDPRWQRAIRDGDGIHPADEGYDVLAELVDGWTPWRALVERHEPGEQSATAGAP